MVGLCWRRLICASKASFSQSPGQRNESPPVSPLRRRQPARRARTAARGSRAGRPVPHKILSGRRRHGFARRRTRARRHDLVLWPAERQVGKVGSAGWLVQIDQSRQACGAPRRHHRTRRRALGDRRRAKCDRARRSRRSQRSAVSFAGKGSLRQPQYGRLRQERYLLVHRPVRDLWPSRTEVGRYDRVFKAPRGRGPYGITVTPKGDVWYASLAGNHIARIDLATGNATVVEPPTPNQGARRVWSDSSGRIWVSEWNSGNVSVHDPAQNSWKAWKLPGNSPSDYAV